MQQLTLADLASRAPDGRRWGMASICSPHPFVIEAAVQQAVADGGTVLIEATCNQVSHRGG
jgi:D-tagatose-1,6-bisphosphate aldolase subunit GatZ/KbaZ